MRKFSLKRLLIVIGIPIGVITFIGIVYGCGKLITSFLSHLTITEFGNTVFEYTHRFVSPNNIGDCFIFGFITVVLLIIIGVICYELSNYICPKIKEGDNVETHQATK